MAREKFQWMMYTDVDEFVFSDSWLNEQVGPEDKGFQEVKPSCKDLTSGALLNMVMSLSSQRNSLQEFPNLISGNFPSSVGILGHQGLPNTLRERQEKRFKSILLLEASASEHLKHLQLVVDLILVNL
ncbi:hypothetical protein SUGI_0754620 [Cryptomeria japonica]|nr:hypothetical protein SUGI_0754620 [Cryptomeria japonica]